MVTFLELEDLALDLDGDLLRQVPRGHRLRHVRDVAHLVREVARHEVDAVREILPGPRHVPHVGLAAQLAVRAHLAGHAGHLRRERAQLIDHGVDRVLELEDLALDLDGDLLGKIARGHRLRHVRNVAHLAREVARHEVDAVREILPRPRHVPHVGLAAQLAVRAHLAGHARHLRRERPQLIDHRVHGVFQLENLALDVDGDLLRQVPRGHRLRHVRDVAHLAREVARHEVDAVREILPRPRDPLHLGLAPELALGAHLAGHARDLGPE